MFKRFLCTTLFAAGLTFASGVTHADVIGGNQQNDASDADKKEETKMGCSAQGFTASTSALLLSLLLFSLWVSKRIHQKRMD